MPREFTPDEKLKSFLCFRNESQGTMVKEEMEEQQKVNNDNTSTAASTTEEDPIADIGLTNYI